MPFCPHALAGGGPAGSPARANRGVANNNGVLNMFNVVKIVV